MVMPKAYLNFNKEAPLFEIDIYIDPKLWFVGTGPFRLKL